MARHLLRAGALLIALGTSGCLRRSFDLCAPPAPNPECALVDAAPAADADTAPDGGPRRDAARAGDGAP